MVDMILENDSAELDDAVVAIRDSGVFEPSLNE